MAYDYSRLDVKARAILHRVTSDIRARINSTAQGILTIGVQLMEAKEALPSGEFGMWLEGEFEWEERAARRMMAVASMIKDKFASDNLSEMKIAPSALYLLASPSTPDEIRDEFINKAEKGKPVTHAEVKEAVKEAKPELRRIICGGPKAIKAAAWAEKHVKLKVDSPFPDSTLIDETLSALARFKGCVTALIGDIGASGDGDPCGFRLRDYRQEWAKTIEAMRRNLKCERPYAVCPYCEGKQRRCDGCKGQGWVGRACYESAPREMKEAVKGSIET